LEYQHVRVDSHTDGQNEAGQSWQRESSVESGKCGQRPECVHCKPEHREHARKAVVTDHDDDDERERDLTGNYAVVNRVGAEAGTDVGDLGDLERNRERACAKYECEILCSLQVAAAECDLALRANGALNYRRATHDKTVEHNRHVIADVLAGLVAEATTTLVVQRELDDGSFRG